MESTEIHSRPNILHPPEFFAHPNRVPIFNLDDQQVLRLHALLYADDSVLFANSAESLQKSLNILSGYSRLWKLKVNVNKTKIMIFSKNGKWSKKHNFTYNEETVDIVNEFKYLGIVFKNNGRFLSAIKLIKAQADKAMPSPEPELKICLWIYN